VNRFINLNALKRRLVAELDDMSDATDALRARRGVKMLGIQIINALLADLACPQRDGNVAGFAPVVPKSIESISYLEDESIRSIILEELSSLETRLHDPSSL